MAPLTVCIVTVSDRCSRGEAEDTSGNNLAKLVADKGWRVAGRECIADERWKIETSLMKWSSGDDYVDVILTTGGTGFSERDVTPEATEAVLERRAPGLVHRMMAESLKVTPLAMLSRLTAGTRGRTVIVNFPGSKKASAECFGFVEAALPHAVDLMRGAGEKVDRTHRELQHGKSDGCQHHRGGGGGGSKVDTSDVAGRERKSPWPMISVEKAQEIVLQHCDSLDLGAETAPFSDALGRVLAEDVAAKDPLPPFPASVKDGYAVISSDGAGLRTVICGVSSDAGSDPSAAARLAPGSCMRINTGGPVPAGADAVVQVEDTRLAEKSADGKGEKTVEILVEPSPGLDIRPIGNDIRSGEKVLAKGSVLGPAEIGLLASIGATLVKVFRRPIVSLLSTGNELQPPDVAKLPPGCIRDSNKATLISLLSQHSVPLVDCGIAVDEPDSLLERLRTCLDRGDVVVTTGGVSMGDRDILRKVLVDDLEAEVHFARVNMKPGKPTTFATLTYNGKKKLVLGLPGNPVSATVTAHLYVLPACRRIGGHERPFPARVRARLGNDGGATVRLDPRPEYRRVHLSWKPGEAVAEARTTRGHQMSSRLTSCQAANGLLILPGKTESRTEAADGDEFDAMIIGELRL